MYTNTDNNFKTLTKWGQFAKNHSKQVVLQEWYEISKFNHYHNFVLIHIRAGSTGSRGGGDNTYFIQKVYDWITDPLNNVAWQSWYYGGDQEFFIFSPNQTVMNQNLEMKNVSKLYKELFGTPLQTTTSSTTSASSTSSSVSSSSTSASGTSSSADTSSSTTGSSTVTTTGEATTDFSNVTISGVTTMDVNGTNTDDMSSSALTLLPSVALSLFIYVFLL